jgi:hypothetical protein
LLLKFHPQPPSIVLSPISTGTRSPGAALNTITGPRKQSTKATAPPTEVTASESGRGQRLRKAPATKEVVPLTDISRKTPEWLRLAYKFLTDKAAGPTWDCCVAAWFAFEGTASPDEITSVSSIVTKYIPPILIQPSQSTIPESKHQPKVLSQWLLTRWYSHLPEISNLTMFGLEWLTWWNALQHGGNHACKVLYLSRSIPNAHQVTMSDHCTSAAPMAYSQY